MVGSGPFRYVANERVSGSREVYQKFDGYVPRPDGVPSFTSGPKVAYLDRVEWNVVPDPATSAAALDSGEFDWWENPSIDLIPQLKRNKAITVVVKDTTGEMGCMRFNQLFPPFDNAAIRRIALSAVNQRDVMDAVAGADPSLIKVPNGLFAADTPLANDAGFDVFKGTADPEALKKALAAAGYKGERVTILAASNFPTINAMAEVGADVLKRIGFNVDYQALDWGTVVQRRASREPPGKGGWNVFFTFLAAPATSARRRIWRYGRTGRRRGSAGRICRRWKRCVWRGSTPRTWRRSRRSRGRCRRRRFRMCRMCRWGCTTSRRHSGRISVGFRMGFRSFMG